MEIPHIQGTGRCDLAVVGESHYQTALTRIAGPQTPDGRRITCLAVLYVEPKNQHDPNAVRVEIDGSTVGHVPREVAPALRHALAQGGIGPGGRAGCDAVIAGGRTGQSYGVWLDIDVDYSQDHQPAPAATKRTPEPTPPDRPWWKFW
jgi:hypothetical protein